jgi:sugar lactone lactonase YvrE
VIRTAPDVLLSGLAIGESARWHDGRLWFCHWIAGDVVVLDPADGSTAVAGRSPVPIPFTIDWLPDGTLLLVAGTQVLRQQPDGSFTTHADLGAICGGFNEIVTDAHGRAYVNGSDFDFLGGGEYVTGTVALVEADGTARRVADGIDFGNGMVITDGGRTLVVAESFGRRLTAFDIAPDGSLTRRRVWAGMSDGPDGLSPGPDGTIWAASMARCVRVREGGEVVDEVALDRFAFSCALRGDTLYVCSADWPGVEGFDPAARTGEILAYGVG